jgi:hypothetical protein
VPGRWGRRETGPVVRPYAVTGGRTEPADGEVLDLLAVLVATGEPMSASTVGHRSPEHKKILKLTEQPARLVDIASDLRLPVGVVRVLLADLTTDGSLRVVKRRPAEQQPNNDVLKEILRGLRAL